MVSPVSLRWRHLEPELKKEIANYHTADDNENNQLMKKRLFGEQDNNGSRNNGSKGHGSKGGFAFSFKKARKIETDGEIHSNRMVSSTTCHEEEVSESITMSTATMRKDAYVDGYHCVSCDDCGVAES